MTTDPLKHELERYFSELHTLLENEGKFAVIKNDDPIMTFDTYDDALKAGYEKYSLEPFLVQKISRIPAVANFTRFSVVPCQV